MKPMTCSDNNGIGVSGQGRDAAGLARYLLLRVRVAKLPISLGITLSCMLGYVMVLPEVGTGFWITAVSCLLLTSGSASLNNLQDRHMDRGLGRTCRRPLPLGRLSPAAAGFQGGLLVVLGLSGLCLTNGSMGSMGLGLAGVALYNGIYTPLKYTTLLAILPGAVCGALPLAMGWVAAGGTLTDPHPGPLLWVMAVMGIWQLPHFWLILLANAGDYRQSRRLSMLTLFDRVQLERILLVWAVLFSVMTLAGVVTVPGLTRVAGWSLVGNAGVTVAVFTGAHYLKAGGSSRVRFVVLNGSMLVFMLVLMADRLALG